MSEEQQVKKQKMSLEGALFCIENPLLDISAEINEEYLKKLAFISLFFLFFVTVKKNFKFS